MQQLTTQIHDTHTQSCIGLSAIFQVKMGWYGDSVANNADENSSIFFLMQMHYTVFRKRKMPNSQQ